MRENRQSGSEGREARKRAFLTPLGWPVMHKDFDASSGPPEGPGR